MFDINVCMQLYIGVRASWHYSEGMRLDITKMLYKDVNKTAVTSIITTKFSVRLSKKHRDTNTKVY